MLYSVYNGGMQELRSFDEVRLLLSKHVPPPRAFRAAYTLDLMKELMAELGNPQDSYKVVHVAGTSGKTSTAYYIASLLKQSGQKVGLAVKPHVDEVNERVQINLQPISEERFCSEFTIFMNKVQETGLNPTYFELLAAFGFWHFAREKVEYVVIEVGMGGLLDGTNVMTRTDKVCVITDIGLDHTSILGDSIPQIAAQKAGIILPHNVAISYDQGDEVMSVFRECSSQLQAELHEVLQPRPEVLPSSLPLYQRRNWYLAFMVYKFIAERDNLPELDSKQLSESTKTYIPARMEVVKVHGKTLVFDGAHNSQKMHALVESMQQRYGGQKIAVLFSLMKSKKQRTISTLEEVIKVANHLIITEFDEEQDMRKVSVKPRKVAEYLEELDFHEWEIVDEPVLGLERLLNRPDDILLITGSFYLLNHLRPSIFSKK